MPCGGTPGELNSAAPWIPTAMPLIHTTSELGSAEALARVLNYKGIPSYVVSQVCLAGVWAPIPNPYCVHILAECDRSRANLVLSRLSIAPVNTSWATRVRLAATFIVLALLLTAQNWS
jgi:hypothetical protein